MGWEPSERHEYQYEGERLVGKTVTRETEWDDTERAWWLAWQEYQAGVCDCGVHHSLARDPANHFALEDDTCPLCRSLAVQFRQRAARDEAITKKLGENPPPEVRRIEDGRKTRLRMLTQLEVSARMSV